MRRSGEESTCLTLWLKAVEVVIDLRFVCVWGGWGAVVLLTGSLKVEVISSLLVHLEI